MKVECMETKKNNKRTGEIGEELATKNLESNGYMIVERNYRVGKFGEIDIIAKKDGYICFVEVKTRKTTFFGMPSEAVNRKKQAKIRKIAWMFLKSKKLEDRYVRFDIVEVVLNGNCPIINIIENAF